MRAMPTPLRTTDPDSTRTYPIGAPRTRHLSHRGNFTNPCFTFLVHKHSFSCMHSYIQIIAYAIIASKRFASRHEVVVVSFDMSGNRPRFEGQPAKGLRPPHIKQSQGRKRRWAPAALARYAQKQIGSSRPSRSILTSSHAHRISIEGRPAGHLSRSLERLRHLPRGGLRSSGMPYEGYADPITNDEPGFHSNMPVSELPECDT